MIASKIIAYISDAEAILSADTLPLPTGISAQVGNRVATFTWSKTVDIRPFLWQVRARADGGSWDHAWGSGEGKQVSNVYVRTLTDDEIAAGGTSVNIEMEVRSIDGTEAVNPTGGSGVAFDVDVQNSYSLGDGTVTVATISDLVAARMFSNSDKDGAELLEESIPAGQLVPAALLPANMHADSLARMFTAAGDRATITANAISGKAAMDKITADIGTAVLASMDDVGSAEGSVTAAEKTKLETALGIALTSLTAASILVAGGPNIATNKAAIKSALDLGNTPNLNAAGILATIDDLDLSAHTTAILAAGLAAAINALSASLVSTALNTMSLAEASRIVGAGAMFDTAGRVKVGVTNGSATRTSTQLVALMDADGHCINIDLSGSNIKHGTLDNIPNGSTYKLVPANSKLGADYAWLGLNASGYLKLGLISGSTTIPVTDLLGLFSHSSDSSIPPVAPDSGTGEYPEIVDTTRDGVTWTVRQIAKVVRNNTTAGYIGVQAIIWIKAATASGSVRIRVVAERKVAGNWVDLSPACIAASAPISLTTYQRIVLSISYALDAPTWVAGDARTILIETQTNPTATLTVEDSVIVREYTETTPLPPS